ncbi:MAG: flagellar basal body rod protein FlgB [Terriglobales bacterium]
MSWMNVNYIHDLQSFLGLNDLRQTLLAANVANLDTPGYRTLGFNFQQALAAAEASPAEAAAAPRIEPVAGLLARPDGNNVSLDREGLLMAQTQLAFHLGIALLTKEFNGIQSAINGGGAF